MNPKKTVIVRAAPGTVAVPLVGSLAIALLFFAAIVIWGRAAIGSKSLAAMAIVIVSMCGIAYFLHSAWFIWLRTPRYVELSEKTVKARLGGGNEIQGDIVSVKLEPFQGGRRKRGVVLDITTVDGLKRLRLSERAFGSNWHALHAELATMKGHPYATGVT